MFGAAAAGAASFFGQRGANAANARMAREQMAFQERMASTEWQRAVADMKAAGLNPALAYEKGGNSSPGGALATMEDAAGKGASSAAEVAATRARIDVDRAQVQNLSAQAERTKEEADTIRTVRAATLAELMSRAGAHVSSARSAEETAARTRELLPYERRELRHRGSLVAEQATSQAVLRELMREQMRLLGFNAREIEQRMDVLERMTPDGINATLQRNVLPWVSGVGEAAGIFRDIGIGTAARSGRSILEPATGNPIGFGR